MTTLTPEIRERHARLSPQALRFLDFTAGNPACQQRLDLWNAGLPDWVLSYPYQLQSWPTFLSGPKLREVQEISARICRLIKAIPERLFEGDGERIAEFYGLEPAAAREILEAPSGAERALARGDYIDTGAGLQCLEMNLSAQIGGWQLRLWADAYLRSGYLAEFMEREGLTLVFRDPFRILVDHLLDHAIAATEIDGPEINLALISPPGAWGPHAQDIIRAFDQDYRQIVGTRSGREGTFLCGGYDLLEGREGKIFSGGRRVHVVLEYDAARTPAFVTDSSRRGQIHLYNGPMTRLWCDKRNLALLSEYQEAGLFAPDDERFLAAHLPWTRLMAADFADYHGDRVFLPDFVGDHRASLVLKQARAARGEGVFIGRSTPDETWRKLLSAALSQEAWVVQEEVESVPYLFQSGARGAALHDVVWGLFTFGDTFGGGFLRMIPAGRHGVINSAQGATEGIFYEVEEPGGADAVR